MPVMIKTNIYLWQLDIDVSGAKRYYCWQDYKTWVAWRFSVLIVPVVEQD